jgi:hypothetical protein
LTNVDVDERSEIKQKIKKGFNFFEDVRFFWEGIKENKKEYSKENKMFNKK